MTDAPLTLYYSPGACSLVAHVLLEEAGASHALERVPLAEGAQRRPDYLAINPRGRVPALRIGDTVIDESIAIATYVARRFPEAALLPADDLLAARVYQRLLFFASSVHVAFAQIWRAERFVGDRSVDAAVQQGGRAAALRHFGAIEAMLDGRAFLVGDAFTAADPYPLLFYRWVARIGVDPAAYPAWTAHARRMLERPGVRRALAAEGLADADFVSA